MNLSARLMAKAGKEGVGVLCDNYTQGENKNVRMDSLPPILSLFIIVFFFFFFNI